MHVHTYIYYEHTTLFQVNEVKNDDSMILVHRILIPGIDTGCIHHINVSGHCVINEKN